jgi:putative membrane-bound dehydrogenase-like protein
MNRVWLLGWGLLALSLTLSAAEEPAPAKVKAVYNSEPSQLPFTSPEDAVKGLTLPPGFSVSIFAAEPDVQQPIGISFDTRGRLWVAENYTYAESSINMDRDLSDRIVILEDTDQDGKSDKRKVFWDQGKCITSVETGFGGVWVLDLPNLLFIPDRNRDDVPDGPPEVVLDGFDRDAVRHNFANGLRWGPDGWLYGRHGILATSRVGHPSAAPAERVSINVGVWRYHPTRKVVEAYAHGTTNPWGMDWDENGELFVINTVIGHLWHAVPGIHWQRMFGEDLQSNLYELVPMIADHYHWDTREQWHDIRKIGVSPTTDAAGGGHAHCGFMIYQGSNWPKEYHGSAFTVNLHGHRLNRDTIERKGATYVAHHAPDFMKVADPWFRGVELLQHPDGSVYIADWTDVGECHENDGVHRTSGRIYRVVCGEALQKYDYTKNPGLLKPLLIDRNSDRNSPPLYNESESRMAIRAIRDNPEIAKTHKDEFTKLATGSVFVPHERLRALWALNAMGPIDEKILIGLLADKEEHLRKWAVRFLCDGQRITPNVASELLVMSKRETSGLVLTYLASAIQKLEFASDRYALASMISSHAEFATDPTLPLMVWYGIEPVVVNDPAAALKLAAETKFPKVRQFIARRLVSTPSIRKDSLDQLAKLLSSGDTQARLDVLTGIARGLEGVRKVPAPEGWEATSAALAKDENTEVQRFAKELSVVFGDGHAMEEIKALAGNDGAPFEARRQAIRTLVDAREESVAPLLLNLLTHRELGIDAVRGLAAVHHPETGKILVDRFNSLAPPTKFEAANTLASRVEFATAMLQGVAESKVDRKFISPFLLRQMQTLGNEALSNKVAELWPELKQLSADKQKKIADWKVKLTPKVVEAANASKGRVLFEQSCAKCHRLFGSPMGIGPDLTGAQRSNMHYLLENIIDPSATLGQNYVMTIAVLKDGRVINGIIGAKQEATTTFNTPTGTVVIANDEIEETRVSALSIMPEGQLDLLKEEQVADLIKYLQSTEQVALP